MTDWRFAWEKFDHLFIRPVRLYFNAQLREQWLRDMVAEGQSKHMLSDDDARTILRQINEPYIQKYLKCLAVHLCTLFVTEATALTLAIIYVMMHSEMPWQQAWARALTIIAMFQIVPVSPGSLVRGLYVLYLVIRERNFKDYNIALFVGFFRYVGYLAFPIQMTYRYPGAGPLHGGPLGDGGGAHRSRVRRARGVAGALGVPPVLQLAFDDPAADAAAGGDSGLVAAAVLACGPVCSGGGGCLRPGRLQPFQPHRPTACSEGVLVACDRVASVVRGVGYPGQRRGSPRKANCGRGRIAESLTGVAATLLSVMIVRTGQAGGAHLAIVQGVWQVFIFTILSTVGAAMTELALPEPRQDGRSRQHRVKRRLPA